MTAILGHLREFREQRRHTVRSLSGLSEAQLTARVEIDQRADVRATLLRLAEDDDRRCATLGGIFAALEWWPTDAQRILASLAASRGYLRAALVGVDDDQLDRQPARDEWGVRQALQHVANNERRFVADATYAVERLRSAEPLALERPDPERGPGALGPPLPGNLDDVLEAVEAVRDEIVALAAPFTSNELAAPTTWAGLTVDVRFMLHRRAMHERQHTVQVQKTLSALGCHQGEAAMLLGHAEIARGTLEGMLLGVPDGLLSRDPGNALPTVEQVLSQAEAEERQKVAAVLSAVS